MKPGFSTVPMGGQMQPGYGQQNLQGYGYLNQPGYRPQPGYGPQQGYGASPQPIYKQISVGQGIDMNEYNIIVECCKQAYISGMKPLSEHCTNSIKQKVGGDWFVFACNMNEADFDFHLTKVKGGDFLSFSLDNKKFEVCRIK